MKQKIAYLTIDDCPSADFKRKINILFEKNIPAIFFCIGHLAEKMPEEVVCAIKKGFIIGNHSYSHPHFSKISLREAEEEVGKTDGIINGLYKRAGINRKIKLFRFPYLDKGARKKDEMQKILLNLGYSQKGFKGVNYNWYKKAHNGADVGCTYDSRDWVVSDTNLLVQKFYGIDNLDGVLKRMDEDFPERGRGLNSQSSNEIIILHDHVNIKKFFMPILDKLISKGIKFRLPEER